MPYLNDCVPLGINQFRFLLRKSAPQDEDNPIGLSTYRLYHSISERLPTEVRMRVCLVGPSEFKKSVHADNP